MNHTEKTIITCFLRFRADKARILRDEDLAISLERIANEVKSQKDGNAAFDKEFFAEVEKTSAALEAKKFLDDQNPSNILDDLLGGKMKF